MLLGVQLCVVWFAYSRVSIWVWVCDNNRLWHTVLYRKGEWRGKKGKMGSKRENNVFPPPPSSPQMNLLDDMLFRKPYPPLFVFLSSPWSEWLCGYQDQSFFFWWLLLSGHTFGSSCLLAKQIHWLYTAFDIFTDSLFLVLRRSHKRSSLRITSGRSTTVLAFVLMCGILDWQVSCDKIEPRMTIAHRPNFQTIPWDRLNFQPLIVLTPTK